MKVLIVGSGGREHALGWKMAQSPIVEEVFVAPGNAGTALDPRLTNVALDVLDIEGLASFAESSGIGLTIIGPEAPLVAGVVDQFNKRGLKCLGPTRAGAQLEGSKAFSKDFLARHDIPTAAYANFTDLAEAEAYIRKVGAPIVVKADGLAAGKGVILAETEEAALEAVQDMLAGNRFGDAGSCVVIEEFLTGEEASFIALVDGEDVVPFATSQDHKAACDGDTGPNTGGMGAYSPAPVVTPDIHKRIMDEVIMPTVRGLTSEDIHYRGFLYAGIMVAPDGTPRVLEFNCRFGDPETQPIMMRLKTDFAELCLAACEGRLDGMQAESDPRAALGVVMAAGGYPGEYAKGKVITGLPQDQDDAMVFHAGTRLDDAQQVLTNGGRVLCATALGRSVSEAQSRAYALVSQVTWEGMYFRTDIGHRAIAREQGELVPD
jgi:phosphoribosylamine--glycine ligase